MELGAEQREHAEVIHRSSIALLRVLNDVLDFSRVEAGRLELESVPFSIARVAWDVQKMFDISTQQKGLKFRCEITDSRPHLAVMGDAGRLRQIIINLLANSSKFTTKGFIRFAMHYEAETADAITARFEVQDSGIGISEEVRGKLFQPFSQGDASTARRFGGTGLGLTISKNLLELMQGRIELSSEPGVGTTVTFWIPFTKAVAEDEKNGMQQPNGGPGPGTATTGPPEFAMTSPPLVISLARPSSDVRQEGPQKRSATRPEAKMSAGSEQRLKRLPRSEREKLHVLLIEDKSVPVDPCSRSPAHVIRTFTS